MKQRVPASTTTRKRIDDLIFGVEGKSVRRGLLKLAAQLSCRATAPLLVPGFTSAALTQHQMPKKPPTVWRTKQVVDELLRRMGLGDFCFICRDNDITAAMDNARVQWSVTTSSRTGRRRRVGIFNTLQSPRPRCRMHDSLFASTCRASGRNPIVGGRTHMRRSSVEQ